MKKKVLALLLASVMAASLFAGCSSSGDSGSSGSSGSGSKVINIYSFTTEIPDAFERYKEMHPEFDWEFNVTVINDEAQYPNSLGEALTAGGASAPDIYMVESAYVLKFTQGDYASYAKPYEDLIPDFASKKDAAKVAQYAVDVGTRDGKVVAMRYQETGCCLIYRRSMAIDTWGTDDPAVVSGKMGPGWDKFLQGAADLKAKGYYAVFGLGDIFKAVRDEANQGWIVNGKLVIDPARANGFDLAKKMEDNKYWVGGDQWSGEWSAAQGGNEVFGFLGPAWLINYVMVGNVGDTFGDWAVTDSPIPWTWGGTWLVGHKDLSGEKAAAVGQLIEWVTLDTSTTGFQYYFAGGNLYEGSNLSIDRVQQFKDNGPTKDAVASAVVMANANGEVGILGGQDMFDYFIPAAAAARADTWTQYDGDIEGWFTDQITQYITGQKTKEQALADFAQKVNDELGFSQ